MKNYSRYRFIVLSSIILVRCCVGLIWTSAGPMLPLIIQEFGLSRSSAGWYASIAPLTIAAVSLPASLLGARFSLKKILAVGAFLQATGVLTFFSAGYLPLLFFRACFAIGTAITIPVATAITAEWFGNRKLPLINGITLSFVNLGKGVAFISTVPIATSLSWDAPVTVYSTFALACAVVWVVLGRERRKEPEEAETSALQVLETRPDLSFKQILTNRSAILLTLSVTVSWSLGNAIGSWLPDYYYTVFNFPLEKASSILALTTVGGTLACITGGILSTRLGRRKPFLIISGLFTGIFALFAVLFNIPAVIYTSVALFGIFGGIHVSSLFTIPMEIPDMSVRSGVIVIAMMLVGGNLGNFVSPLIVGYIVDVTGSYLTGFIIFILLSLGLMIAGILLPETGPKGQATTEQGINP